MLRTFAVTVIMLVSSLSSASLAADVVGKSVVSGKVVELLSDKTWRYVGEASQSKASCRNLADGLEFCGDRNTWKDVASKPAAVTGFFRYDDRHYAMIIYENLGSADGMDHETMRKTIITNAASGAKVDVADVIVHGSEADTVSGAEGERTIYSVKFGGLNATYANSVIIRDKTTMQVITYAISSSFGEKHKMLHAQFSDAIKLK